MVTIRRVLWKTFSVSLKQELNLSCERCPLTPTPHLEIEGHPESSETGSEG